MRVTRALLAGFVVAAMTLVGMSVPFGPAVSAATEIVPNGDLETANPLDATQPANWRHDSWGQTTASFSWPTGGAHGGNHSARIDVSAYTDVEVCVRDGVAYARRLAESGVSVTAKDFPDKDHDYQGPETVALAAAFMAGF